MTSEIQKRHFYNSAFVRMFQVPTLPLCAVASPWRRGSVPEIIDHRNRLYCGNKRRAPCKDAISIFASGRRNNSSPTKLPRETRPQEDECDFETALFGAYYRVSIRDAEAEGCPCDCPYYPQRVGQLSSRLTVLLVLRGVLYPPAAESERIKRATQLTGTD